MAVRAQLTSTPFLCRTSSRVCASQQILAPPRPERHLACQPRALLGALTAPFKRSTASTSAPAKQDIFKVVNGQEVLLEVDSYLTNRPTDTHLLVLFTAEWCGPCAVVKTQLAKLAALRPANSVRVLYADVEHCKELATDLGITSLPHLLFIGHEPGKPCISTVGPVSASLIADVLDTKMHVCGSDMKKRLRLS